MVQGEEGCEAAVPGAPAEGENTAAADGVEKLSASERRKQRKAEQAVARKADKLSRKGQETGAKKLDANDAGSSAVDELDPTKYYENRQRMLREARENHGFEVYPHKWNVTISIPKFVEKYKALGDGEQLPEDEVKVAGRLMRAAGSGKSLRFYDVVAEDTKIQVMASASYHDPSTGDFFEVHNLLRRCDVVGIRGFPGKSKRGELSIFPKEVKLLSPCLHMVPKGFQTLKDQEIRYRRRYLDFLVNQDTKQTFIVRAKIIKHLRNFLEMEGFIEVETPMMNLIAGGANARPFVTHHNELDTDLFMRVAPELSLKMLVVGGMDRVFEIGKNFRNEGIDLTHNPEFTGCEFYEAYADVYDLMDKTERLLHSMVMAIHGKPKVEFCAEVGEDGSSGRQLEIDFSPPYPRLSMVDEIERQSGTKLPRPLDSADCVDTMVNLVKSNGLELPTPPTPSKLLDKLCGFFVEDKIVSPTFIIEHPQIMSPLAKWHREKAEMSERGELFVAGKELCNFYTELNDPERQRGCFMDQAKAKSAGDDEGMEIDEEFCVALEHALPPTGGWGIGIDRLVMFLTNKNSIKEVLLFPALRPQQPQQVPTSDPSKLL